MDELEKEQQAVEQVDKHLQRFPDDLQVLQELQAKALDAAEALGRLVYSENDNVKLAAARDILDRTGFKPVERKDVTSGGLSLMQPTITDDQLMNIINGFIKRTAIDVPAGEVGPAEEVVSEGP